MEPTKNPFSQIAKDIEDARDENQREYLDEFRGEVLNEMNKVNPVDWLNGAEVAFNSRVISDPSNICYQIVASELYDVGFNISHMVGSKFIVRQTNIVENSGPENPERPNDDAEKLKIEISKAFDKMVENEVSGVGFIATIEPFYVQFITYEDGEVGMEAVHNVYLKDEHKISREQEKALEDIGFELLSDGNGDPINWHVWEKAEHARSLLDVSVRVLLDVYGADSEDLKIEFV